MGKAFSGIDLGHQDAIVIWTVRLKSFKRLPRKQKKRLKKMKALFHSKPVVSTGFRYNMYFGGVS